MSLSSWYIASCIFIISQLWLTSHPRSTVVLLDTGASGNSREIYSEDANDGTRSIKLPVTFSCETYFSISYNFFSK